MRIQLWCRAVCQSAPRILVLCEGRLFLFAGLCGGRYGICRGDCLHLPQGDPAVVATGAAALRWQFITYPLGAWIVVSNMMLQTIRKPVRATILSSARQGLFFIPLIFILPYFLGLKGVEMCQAASDMLTFFLAIPLTCGVLAEMKRKEAEQLQQRQS